MKPRLACRGRGRRSSCSSPETASCNEAPACLPGKGESPILAGKPADGCNEAPACLPGKGHDMMVDLLDAIALQ